MSKKCKSAASKLSSDGLAAIEEDDVFIEKGSTKDWKKMKLFSSKRKSSLFIPGLSFRKNKKLFRYKGRELANIGPLSEDSLLVRPCDGDNVSIKSSVSSLEEQLSDQRTDSVDSGIDCLHPAFMSGANPSCGKRTAASPLSSTASLPSQSTSKLLSDLPSNPKMQKRFSESSIYSRSHSKTGQSSKGKGRAPIASPEDDSLLDNPDSDSDCDLQSPPRKPVSVKNSPSAHNSSASSFHTLSDCSSCESDTDSYTDSDSNSSCSSDGQSCRFDRSTESDSDSDSDTSQCSAYYVPPKCYLDSSLSKNVSPAVRPGHIQVSGGSKLPSNSVHTNCVNTSKNAAKQEKHRKARIEKAPLSFFRKRKDKKSSKDSKKADKSLSKSETSEKLFNFRRTATKLFDSSHHTEDRTCSRSKSCDKLFNSSCNFNTSQIGDMSVDRRSLNSSSRSLNSSSRSLNNSSRSLNNSSRSLNNSSRSLNNSSRSLNNSSRSLNNSSRSLNSSSRSLNSAKRPVNSTSQDVNSRRNSRSQLIKDGRNVKSSGNSVVMENPHVLVNPSPQYMSSQADHSIMVTPVRESCSMSNLTAGSRSAFSRCNTTGSLPRQRISYVDGESSRFTSEEPIYHEIDDLAVRNGASDHYVNIRATNNTNMSSFGYVQMSAVKNMQPVTADLGRTMRRSDDRPQNEYCEMVGDGPLAQNEYSEMYVMDNSINVCDQNSQLPLNNCDKDASACLETSPNIPLDTSKSIVDVRRAMRKTAFWVENATYDSTCGSEDGSPSSLLKDKKSVSEMDLCNQIIDIYFGEDSDSSLSSSCLETSLDQDSSLSFGTDENASPDEFPTVLTSPQTIETNVDDYSVATFVSEPYQTSEARMRKIRNADNEPRVQLDQTVRKADTQNKKPEKLPVEKPVLKEKFQNVNTPKKSEKKKTTRTPSVSRVFSNSRPPSLLSEQEVDTITKLHTICNSQRKVSYLDISKAEMVIKHYPPPKHASRISWCDQLANDDLNHHTPTTSPARRSILHQRPQSFIFPYVEDEPSPIVITRLRRIKSSSRRKEWPW
ncbi:dentin sialophosphoprotein-like isoform X2 [Pecten maximus]|uniref:dentin sialophosphoprotein-like isoform X2 n=1 Tax=Pecten maximus TaxID=6579 RepID=UPI0014583377|nr:dentin sialophosphoprotein-like isoform X2 [Pecten maximus]